jgi:hypothetical protein
MPSSACRHHRTARRAVHHSPHCPWSHGYCCPDPAADGPPWLMPCRDRRPSMRQQVRNFGASVGRTFCRRSTASTLAISAARLNRFANGGSEIIEAARTNQGQHYASASASFPVTRRDSPTGLVRPAPSTGSPSTSSQVGIASRTCSRVRGPGGGSFAACRSRHRAWCSAFDSGLPKSGGRPRCLEAIFNKYHCGTCSPNRAGFFLRCLMSNSRRNAQLKHAARG